jgi:uncharacterized protein YkwD
VLLLTVSLRYPTVIGSKRLRGALLTGLTTGALVSGGLVVGPAALLPTAGEAAPDASPNHPPAVLDARPAADAVPAARMPEVAGVSKERETSPGLESRAAADAAERYHAAQRAAEQWEAALQEAKRRAAQLRVARAQAAQQRGAAPAGSAPAGAAVVAAPAARSAPVDTTAGTADDAAADVVTLTNAERQRAGCDPLEVDSRLTAAAQAHAEDMAANDYFSHTSRDGSSFADRIRAAGHPSPAAENIAQGQPDARSVVADWMESEGHRRNILNCSLRTIGVGHAGAKHCWVQNFAR